ncbi:MAG: hypothetical protein AB8B85_01470 [Paracoccaceae bacterium]
MKLVHASLIVGALGLAAPAAHAQTPTPNQNLMQLFQRIYAHYSILLGRSFVDLTYDSLTMEPNTGAMVISGLTLYPEMDWDDDGACAIDVDRAIFGSITSFETLASTIEVSGVALNPACLPADQRGMLAAFGYGEGLVADTMTIEIAYDLPSSGANVTVQAAVRDAADISIAANFDYLWFRVPTDDRGDPKPVAILGDAEIAVENAGLWERVEPMVAAQMGDVNAIPAMAQLTLGQVLMGPDGTTTPEATAFVANLSEELTRFLTEKNRLVVSVQPENGLWLDEDTFEGPAQAIAVLKPEVSGIPAAYRNLVSPAELSTALQGGSGMDTNVRLRVGEALLTGLGAPRSVADGVALLSPLANDWNGDAALLVAGALVETGDTATGYPMTLRALAGGGSGAIGLADAMESAMTVEAILAAQESASRAWPGNVAAAGEMDAMIAAGDIPGLRRMAFAASVGKSMPRSYARAYYLASLAAAGGDKGAANLRRRLDARFADAGSDAWRAEADRAARVALETWTASLGGVIADRVK